MKKFIPKKVPIRIGHRFVAVLNKKDAHAFDLQPGDRVKLKNTSRVSEEITAMIDISENGEFKNGHIGLFSETYDELKVKRGDRIRISIMEKPKSIEYIKQKLDGKRLKANQIDEIIKDVIEDDLTEVELTYFVAATYFHGLSDQETAELTKAIVKHGTTLEFPDKVVVDKHCIGGVPGNRTTMVIIPTVGAAGLTMPKTSSRAITSPSGTADTMEVIANVTLEAKDLKRVVKKANAFIAWGGGVDIASADDHMIRVRHQLKIDPEGMLLASIMAKKFAVGSTHVLIDIPYGPQAKVSKKEGEHLKKRFEKIGKLLGMNTKVILTKAQQPIGNGIGPVLEVMDVMKVLKNEPDAPKDLKKKSAYMAGLILEMADKAEKGKGEEMALELIESGKAYEQMQKIIKAQGPTKYELRMAKNKTEILAPKSGKISKIDNKMISRIARIAGAPDDKQAGIYLHKKLNQKVKKGELMMTIYADSQERLDHIKELKLKSPISIR